jgi:kynurenine formamidase
LGDAGSEENPSRHVLLGSEAYVVENLDGVPPFCPFVALPLKIRGGLQVVRAVALLPGR